MSVLQLRPPPSAARTWSSLSRSRQGFSMLPSSCLLLLQTQTQQLLHRSRWLSVLPSCRSCLPCSLQPNRRYLSSNQPLLPSRPALLPSVSPLPIWWLPRLLSSRRSFSSSSRGRAPLSGDADRRQRQGQQSSSSSSPSLLLRFLSSLPRSSQLRLGGLTAVAAACVLGLLYIAAVAIQYLLLPIVVVVVVRALWRWIRSTTAQSGRQSRGRGGGEAATPAAAFPSAFSSLFSGRSSSGLSNISSSWLLPSLLSSFMLTDVLSAALRHPALQQRLGQPGDELEADVLAAGIQQEEVRRRRSKAGDETATVALGQLQAELNLRGRPLGLLLVSFERRLRGDEGERLRLRIDRNDAEASDDGSDVRILQLSFRPLGAAAAELVFDAATEAASSARSSSSSSRDPTEIEVPFEVVSRKRKRWTA